MGQKERRRSSALKMFLGDYLNLASNAPVLKLMARYGDKTVIFSDVIIKVNKRNKMQERIFLLTEKLHLQCRSWKLSLQAPYSPQTLGQCQFVSLARQLFRFAHSKRIRLSARQLEED